MARSLLRSGRGPEDDRLDLELSAVSVLAEVARRGHRDRVADRLLGELETLARRVVDLLGEDHPTSGSALVALASAEFAAATAARDRDRMERAVDVLALAAQKTSATLGATHPQALATLRAFAGAEYEAAALLGPERRRADARALVESVAARSRNLRAAHESAEAPAPEDADALRFSVLGPVGARRGEGVLPTGSPRQRALLAMLLLRGDHAATAQELTAAIWDEDPPARAEAAVRTYAHRLRKCLGDEVFVNKHGRYTLRIRDTDVDLARAEAAASAAETAVAEGDAEGGRALYAAALAEFSGEPLAGVPGLYAERHRTRLSEWRQTLLERRVALDLETGRYAEAAAELTALTAANPLREHLRELLTVAQHRLRAEDPDRRPR
ncbi:BTAD domain-containing putative transcriptional regulator [Streptomyces sp. WMMC500]|uniref:AfsR/SARP family transcriptional regulator n=1 Tax=Streptomyces sp. WMMC500 TaxID=3015154 RepID=UPI00248C36B9|nr:BTAD domain-containing putative transcriptional regulator [Streptomyces sp. WMMC500]WBB57676.1 BTAD domain-containing putative transcriptional regulator [Streptomyces sp. WMMC500]